MPRPPQARSLLTHALVAACALGLGRASAGWPQRAGSAAAPAGVATPPRAGLRTWADAQVEARARALPVLLLLAPPHDACPPARSLAKLILGEGAERLLACAVPASLEVDETAPASEGAALLARVGEHVLPCLVVFSPEGEILARQFGGLYPSYDLRGLPLDPAAQETLHDVEGLVRLVDAAVGRGQREARRLEALLAAADPLGRLEAAELLERRGRVAQAAAEARHAAGHDLPADAALRAARLLVRLGQAPAAGTTLKQALARSPAPAERARLALALDRIEALPARPPAASALPSLSEVLAQAEARQDGAVVLDARVRIALDALARGDRSTLGVDLAWCRENLALLPADAEQGVPIVRDLLLLAEGAEQPAFGAVLMKALMERYPAHPFAQGPKHGLLCEAEVKAGLRRD